MVPSCQTAPLVAAGHFALVGGHSRTATVFSTQPHSRLNLRLESDDRQARKKEGHHARAFSALTPKFLAGRLPQQR